MSADREVQPDNKHYPPFAFTLWERPGVGVFAYKVLGRNQTATPLVLVTGLSAVGLVDWNPLAQELAKARPVLIFDNRGIGASTLIKAKQNEKFTAKDMANDVAELVKHLGWGEIDVCGYSLGGMITQQLLVQPNLPFTIRHAVLAATSAKPAHSDLLSAIPNPDKRPETIEEKIALVKPFVLVGYSPDFVANPKNAALIDQRVMESIHTRRPAALIQKQLAVIAGYDVRKEIPSIPKELKVLVIHGTLDRSVYYTESKYIMAGIKHAKLLTFEGVGHAWYDYYSTEYWANLLNAFLDNKPVDNLVPAKGGKL